MGAKAFAVFAAGYAVALLVAFFLCYLAGRAIDEAQQ